jgi:hypothetical protein
VAAKKGARSLGVSKGRRLDCSLFSENATATATSLGPDVIKVVTAIFLYSAKDYLTAAFPQLASAPKCAILASCANAVPHFGKRIRVSVHSPVPETLFVDCPGGIGAYKASQSVTVPAQPVDDLGAGAYRAIRPLFLAASGLALSPIAPETKISQPQPGRSQRR